MTDDTNKAQQLLPLPDAPESDESLRAAYAATKLRSYGITFEHALRDRAIRIGLKNITVATLRARAETTR